ncbi:putative nucleotide-diphospho-sugar transferase [Reinekea marina]|uniref:Nucleotide-diphospho-sugar transferase n=1 Tax=Reinekea marina TaxID=1310421 RepID=A0ABV7WU58_9GAMM|nr:putative nucleotide-diphospho-sugar transferase [Reinekea marina]MDN3649329.1 putative nucleotide-diphospho-sugar transferase [Reinekea marina]
MRVVGYYTTDTTYKDHVELLKKSLERFKVEYDFIEIAPADWLKATAFKPTAILELMEKHQESVLYLDVDSVIHENVEKYFETLDADIAAHYKDENELISSTVYLNYNEQILELLRTWRDQMVKTPEIWDQKVLQNLLESPQFKHLRLFKLPPSYTYIFDLTKKTHPNLKPVIEQLQASREARHAKVMATAKYKRWSKFGLYPRSTHRMRSRRKRLEELSKEYNVKFTYSYTP